MYENFSWPTLAEKRNRLTRAYEPFQPFFLMELARNFKPQIFLDIGANVGVYSLFMSTVASIETVHSVEAASSTFSLLRKVVNKNNLDGIIDLHNIAVSNFVGELSFGVVSPLSGANSIISTSIHARSKFTEVLTVQTTTLDKLVNERDQSICIKMDIEGHEVAAVEGARLLFKKNRVLLQIEEYGDRGLISYLETLGFRTIMRIGPDYYLTNDPHFAFEEKLIGIFEEAVNQMIKSHKTQLNLEVQSSAIRIDIFRVATIELRGTPARIARYLKKIITNSLGKMLGN